MDISAAGVAVQQSMSQQQVAMSMLKRSAEAEKAIVDLVAASASGRGLNLDVIV